MWISEAAKTQFLQVVEKAAVDEAYFNTFRCQPSFYSITGVTEIAYVLDCMSELGGQKEVRVNYERFKELDKLSIPFSHDVARFAHSVMLLHKEFGDLSEQNVVEFGGSFGGLAYCVLTQWPKLKSYTLLDLPEVQRLAKKYLSKLPIDLNKLSWEIEEDKPIDLFISEYCLSEQTDWLTYYYERFIPRSKKCLLRINFNEPKDTKQLLCKLTEQFPTVISIPEGAIRSHNTIVICRD